VIRLDAPDCISAVYSREGEAWILLGNTAPEPRQVRLRISPGNLPVPLRSLGSVQLIEGGATTNLDASRAAGEGESVRIPADGAVLLRIAR